MISLPLLLVLLAFIFAVLAEQLNARPLLWGDRETKGKTFCVHAR